MSGQDEKPFDIPKTLIWQAWERVAANGGAPGADGVTIEDFKAGLRDNLYKIWNRMSSGTYFPPPVRAVEIPKASGGTRILGVPTVGDRVAQTAASMALEPRAESIFHDDSYGYRRNRGALDAVGTCRKRCWEKPWVIDLDIRKFFDSVPWDLVVKAVEANVTHAQRWITLYVKRWLAAPIVMPDGRKLAREMGTPQGSAISPVLANSVQPESGHAGSATGFGEPGCVPAHRAPACALRESGERRDGVRGCGGLRGRGRGRGQGWPANSRASASRASMPHLPAVDR